MKGSDQIEPSDPGRVAKAVPVLSQYRRQYLLARDERGCHDEQHTNDERRENGKQPRPVAAKFFFCASVRRGFQAAYFDFSHEVLPPFARLMPAISSPVIRASPLREWGRYPITCLRTLQAAVIRSDSEIRQFGWRPAARPPRSRAWT